MYVLGTFKRSFIRTSTFTQHCYETSLLYGQQMGFVLKVNEKILYMHKTNNYSYSRFLENAQLNIRSLPKFSRHISNHINHIPVSGRRNRQTSISSSRINNNTVSGSRRLWHLDYTGKVNIHTYVHRSSERELLKVQSAFSAHPFSTSSAISLV